MILIDTNFFIYFSNGTVPASIIGRNKFTHASVTRIEALGFGELPVSQATALHNLFAHSNELDLTPVIVDRAIELRRTKKMRLGDSIIAATAIEHDAELWTADQDFDGVPGLTVRNPAKG